MTSEIIDVWPTCPQCQTARCARCQLCGAERDFFPQAFQADENAGELRFCTSCDDVAQLQYFRECTKCGHDFGEGYTPPDEPPPEDHSRAMRVLMLLIAGAAIIGAYFYWLLRR
ncbi:hypothetical protein [Anatilimnocola floriformis]|uniref:hypothetical protein n=1 Tax=Anatilimnocola floriformis TaxID=2948575 RepID=UPI0020C4BF5F|nr:hypothetical protein [Anatilimnocola floriformis]